MGYLTRGAVLVMAGGIKADGPAAEEAEEMEKKPSLQGESARIRFIRHASCRNCGGCLTGGNRENEMLIPIPEGIELKPGDRVKILMEPTVFLRAAFQAYVVPLLFFFLGYAAGNRLFVLLALESHGKQEEYWAVFSSFSAFSGLRFLTGAGRLPPVTGCVL